MSANQTVSASSVPRSPVPLESTGSHLPGCQSKFARKLPLVVTYLNVEYRQCG